MLAALCLINRDHLRVGNSRLHAITLIEAGWRALAFQ